MSLYNKLNNTFSSDSAYLSGTVPLINGVYDQTGSVIGNLNSGDQTDERNPIISGIGTVGSTVLVKTEDTNGQHNIGSTVVKADGTWSLQPTASLESGNNKFTAVEIDINGDISASSEPFSIMVTTYPIIPSIPIIMSVEDNVGAIKGSVTQGGLTDDNTPMVRGQTGSNEIVMVYSNDTLLGSAQADVHGFWMFTPETPLADGEYHLTVTNLNSSSTNSTANFSFTINTQIITAPTIELILDNQGAINSGATTDDTTPTLTGKAQQGSVIAVFDNGVLLGSAIANSDNQWSFTPSTSLATGSHYFSVGEIDVTGNISYLSDNILLNIETSYSESILTISDVYDQTGDVTGNLSNAAQTDESRPVIKGIGTAGDIILVHTLDNTGHHEIGRTIVNTDGTWTLQPTSPLSLGHNQLTAIAIGVNGNINASTEPFNITVMDTATHPLPPIPVIDYALDNIGSMQGALYQGSTTDDNTPTLIGSAASKEIVLIYDNGELIGSVQADDKGQWSFTPTTPLLPGDHYFSASKIFAEGEIHQQSAVLNLQIIPSSLPETIATIEFALDDAGKIQGRLNNGSLTDDTTPTLSGKAEKGHVITVHDNGVLLGSVVVNSEGEWNFTPTIPLISGHHFFTVSEINAKGEMSPPTSEFVLNIDAPASESVISISGVYDHTGDVTGNLSHGDMTDENRPVIKGIGTAGDIIIVHTQDSTGHHEIGRTVVNADGTWILEPVSPLSIGHNQLSAIAMGADGNANASTPPFDITVIDTEAHPLPPIPVIDYALDNVGAIQGMLFQGSTTDDNTPTLMGTAQSKEIILIQDSGILLGSAQADESGQWSFTPSEPLSSGDHYLSASKIFAEGEFPQFSAVLTLHITPPPFESAMGLTHLYGQKSDVIGNLNFGESSNEETTEQTMSTTLSDILQMGPTEITFINNGEKLNTPQSDSTFNQQATFQTGQQYEGHINNNWSMSVSPIEIPIENLVSPIIM